MKYKTVIFDLDGTLCDTLLDLQLSLNYALSYYGYPEKTIAEVKSFVGDGVSKLVSRALPADTPKARVVEAVGTFLSRYSQHCLDNTQPYIGIPEAIDKIKKTAKIAVASNKSDSEVKTIVETFFGSCFDCVAGMSAGDNKKPAPDVVFKIANALGVSPSDCVLVGDSPVDVMTAANAGCAMIGVAWGFAGKTMLTNAGCQVIVDDAVALTESLGQD